MPFVLCAYWWPGTANSLLFECSCFVYLSGTGKKLLAKLFQLRKWLNFAKTLDAVDGKQARRTGSQSPGFDHGCDSLSTIFLSLSVMLTVGAIQPELGLLKRFIK